LSAPLRILRPQLPAVDPRGGTSVPGSQEGKMARERSMKHTILRSFETLIKRMDPAEQQEAQERQEQQEQQKQQERQKRRERQKQQEPVKPRTIVATGEFLGRNWRVYSDGAFEGETVLGMEAFRDLDHFKSLVEVSPVLRNERSTRNLEQATTGPGPAGEAPPIAAVPAADGATAATARTDAIGSPSLENDRAAHPAVAKPVRSYTDLQLARDLAIAGGLGIVLCVAWWFRFYVFDDLHAELLRRGLGENVIRSTNLSIPGSLSCFFLNTESCVAMQNWGRFAGRLAYEPAFAWASTCALGLGLLLIHVQNSKLRDRSVEE
jgi:hypothetical protein